MFGYTDMELRTLRISDLVPDDERERHDRLVGEYRDAPRRRKMGSGLSLRGKTKSGAIVALDIALGPFESEGRRYVLAVMVNKATTRLLAVLNDVLAKIKAANAELAAVSRPQGEA